MLVTTQSAEIGELISALAGVQKSMRAAAKSATNPHLGSKYADLKSVVRAFQPELGDAGMAIIQTCEEADGCTFVATTLGHSSGQWIRGALRVETSPQKGLNLAQSQGLALTYARRYSLAAIVAVVTEDDDGGNNDPPPQKPAKPVVVANFDKRFAKAREVLGDEAVFAELTKLNITGFENIPATVEAQTAVLNALGAVYGENK